MRASKILKALGTPCLIHQPRYSMFDRWIENDLTDVLSREGIGGIVFSPLERGLLTDRYLNGIPADSRVGKGTRFMPDIPSEKIDKVRKLNEIARSRGQTMAQLALAWVLRLPQVTSALIGSSKVSQIEDAVATLKNLEISPEELAKIENILAG